MACYESVEAAAKRPKAPQPSTSDGALGQRQTVYMGIDVNDIEAFEEICGAHDYKNRTIEAANAISAEIMPKGTRVRLANSPTGPCFSLEGDGNEVPESEASGPAPR